MKLLTSLFFTAFCMLSTLNASEPLLKKTETTDISIGTTAVKIPRNDVFQANIDLSALKFWSAVSAVMWTNLLINCYSECSQISYLNTVAGNSSAHTFHLALTYFKLSWFPEKRTLTNLTPYAGLFAITVLAIAVEVNKLYYLSMPVGTFCVEVWLNFLLALRRKIIERPKTPALAN